MNNDLIEKLNRFKSQIHASSYIYKLMNNPLLLQIIKRSIEVNKCFDFDENIKLLEDEHEYLHRSDRTEETLFSNEELVTDEENFKLNYLDFYSEEHMAYVWVPMDAIASLLESRNTNETDHMARIIDCNEILYDSYPNFTMNFLTLRTLADIFVIPTKTLEISDVSDSLIYFMVFCYIINPSDHFITHHPLFDHVKKIYDDLIDTKQLYGDTRILATHENIINYKIVLPDYSPNDYLIKLKQFCHCIRWNANGENTDIKYILGKNYSSLNTVHSILNYRKESLITALYDTDSFSVRFNLVGNTLLFNIFRNNLEGTERIINNIKKRLGVKDKSECQVHESKYIMYLSTKADLHFQTIYLNTYSNGYATSPYRFFFNEERKSATEASSSIISMICEPDKFSTKIEITLERKNQDNVDKNLSDMFNHYKKKMYVPRDATLGLPTLTFAPNQEYFKYFCTTQQTYLNEQDALLDYERKKKIYDLIFVQAVPFESLYKERTVRLPKVYKIEFNYTNKNMLNNIIMHIRSVATNIYKHRYLLELYIREMEWKHKPKVSNTLRQPTPNYMSKKFCKLNESNPALSVINSNYNINKTCKPIFTDDYETAIAISTIATTNRRMLMFNHSMINSNVDYDTYKMLYDKCMCEINSLIITSIYIPCYSENAMKKVTYYVRSLFDVYCELQKYGNSVNGFNFSDVDLKKLPFKIVRNYYALIFNGSCSINFINPSFDIMQPGVIYNITFDTYICNKITDGIILYTGTKQMQASDNINVRNINLDAFKIESFFIRLHSSRVNQIKESYDENIRHSNNVNPLQLTITDDSDSDYEDIDYDDNNDYVYGDQQQTQTLLRDDEKKFIECDRVLFFSLSYEDRYRLKDEQFLNQYDVNPYDICKEEMFGFTDDEIKEIFDTDEDYDTKIHIKYLEHKLKVNIVVIEYNFETNTVDFEFPRHSLYHVKEFKYDEIFFIMKVIYTNGTYNYTFPFEDLNVDRFKNTNVYKLKSYRTCYTKVGELMTSAKSNVYPLMLNMENLKEVYNRRCVRVPLSVTFKTEEEYDVFDITYVVSELAKYNLEIDGQILDEHGKTHAVDVRFKEGTIIPDAVFMREFDDIDMYEPKMFSIILDKPIPFQNIPVRTVFKYYPPNVNTMLNLRREEKKLSPAFYHIPGIGHAIENSFNTTEPLNIDLIHIQFVCYTLASFCVYKYCTGTRIEETLSEKVKLIEDSDMSRIDYLKHLSSIKINTANKICKFEPHMTLSDIFDSDIYLLRSEYNLLYNFYQKEKKYGKYHLYNQGFNYYIENQTISESSLLYLITFRNSKKFRTSWYPIVSINDSKVTMLSLENYSTRLMRNVCDEYILIKSVTKKKCVIDKKNCYSTVKDFIDTVNNLNPVHRNAEYVGINIKYSGKNTPLKSIIFKVYKVPTHNESLNKTDQNNQKNRYAIKFKSVMDDQPPDVVRNMRVKRLNVNRILNSPQKFIQCHVAQQLNYQMLIQNQMQMQLQYQMQPLQPMLTTNIALAQYSLNQVGQDISMDKFNNTLTSYMNNFKQTQTYPTQTYPTQTYPTQPTQTQPTQITTDYDDFLDF